MNRKIYFWKLPSAELPMGERTLIMGVLNVTPDSFSDGGRFTDPERACARALEMEAQGADLIDIGAESTRPDSKRISAEEEWRRLLPVLKLLRDQLTIPLSLDTYKSEIAERAVQYGVSIFNDPSGLTFDANLARVAAEHNAGLILNHMRGTPETWGKQPALSDVIAAVSRDLDATVSRARRAGVEKSRIVIDPGLGFGKRREQNSEIIAHLGRLAELDYPILTGPSRKSFLTHAAEGETPFATAAAVTASVLYGAHMVRVHDVKDMRAAAAIADEILRVAAVHRVAAEMAADEQQRPAVRPRTRPEVPFLTGERAIPTRPPLAAKPPAPEPVAAAPLVAESVAAEPVAAETPNEPVPTEQTGESVAEAPTPPPPPTPPAPKFTGDRPVLRRPAADRPPRRDDNRPLRKDNRDRPGDRPPRREFRPAAGGPQRRDDSRPPRPYGDRPERPYGDRPQRPYGDRPQRPAGPPRGEGDRPPRPYGDRPSGPPRGGDRRPPRGDESRPPRKDFGPPRPGAGPRPGGKPRGDGPRPPRPFRKRP